MTTPSTYVAPRPDTLKRTIGVINAYGQRNADTVAGGADFDVDGSTVIDEILVDNFDRVSVTLALEEEFEVELPDDLADGNMDGATVEQLAAIVDRHLLAQ